MNSSSPNSPKILIGDDSATIRMMLEKYLEEERFESSTASDGREVLEQFRKVEPEVVILDLQMPVLDGFSVCKAIKEDSSVPVIILTSMDEDSDRDWALSQGADAYLTKPVEKEELLDTIRKFVPVDPGR